MLIFSETKQPITLNQITEIEQHLDLVFPEAYKLHLLQYNGGYCEPNIFSFEQNGKINNSCIDWFLAIYEGKYNNLWNTINNVKLDEKRLPTHMLPIANDPGGNLVCISCGPTDYGCVYFWDHELEVDYTESDDTDYSNLYLIAYNFKQFLAELLDSIG
jgi:cell wall assembly regulator SMI1